MDPTADVDAVEYLSSSGNRTPVVQPVAIKNELSRLQKNKEAKWNNFVVLVEISSDSTAWK